MGGGWGEVLERKWGSGEKGEVVKGRNPNLQKAPKGGEKRKVETRKERT